MEIIIGREEGARRLHCIAGGRNFNLGVAGSVPTSVSRKHCKLIITGERLSIENLSDLNVTFVDGNQVFSKVITANSQVQLGKEKYNLPLKEIIGLVAPKKTTKPSKPAKPEKEVPTFSLAPLEEVWNEYDRLKQELQQERENRSNKHQKKMGLRMAVSAIPVVGSFANALMGASMMASSNKESIAVQLRKLDEELDEIYKCPNPECGRPFGPTPYRRLKFTPKCPSCGCKYTTD